jgi:hypothetical protein
VLVEDLRIVESEKIARAADVARGELDLLFAGPPRNGDGPGRFGFGCRDDFPGLPPGVVIDSAPWPTPQDSDGPAGSDGGGDLGEAATVAPVEASGWVPQVTCPDGEGGALGGPTTGRHGCDSPEQGG